MLETVFILNTALASVRTLVTWIEQVQWKQKKLRQLKRTIGSLEMILEPLCEPSARETLDKSIAALLYDVAEILNGTKEHLSLCSGKTKMSKMMNVVSLLNPSIVLGMLYDDEKKLSQWISLFTLSLHIAALGERSGRPAGPSPQAISATDWMPSNDDISSFWSTSFGEENVFVYSDEFIAALERWIQEQLNEMIRNALLLEVDRNNIGGVTRRALEGFACERTVKECVNDLRSQYSELGLILITGVLSDDETIMTDASLSPISPLTMNSPLSSISPLMMNSPLSPISPSATSSTLCSSPTSFEPTLVWIDDKMGNNQAEIDYAVLHQIRVIQLPTTAIAKLWIEQNRPELQVLESRRLLHFVTDNARWEAHENGPGGASLNMSAGETILRYLRGRGFKAPVLVYCGRSIPLTSYVTSYSGAASTTHPAVCMAFMEQLSLARDGVAEDQRFWSSFMAGQGFNLFP
ncbi:hypothetical protein AX15_002209 [Amanita polypyramis BW_CC]|nr:hypothetical protein AX15_002209 [Amanita polypyramis BW_CC]